ncbi:hypothetical protein [Paractinoplanes abujensis]|uniref:Uncharacterized protein n=1 Tax=Paractinoplanes abujensis TaxID=882441 RepID=A0A7W7CPS8_9ACTN|nr:hypothetical protein [Actinoplanes abujensis]MBB4692489.1 hypothetical protein [Actinoplanes abujensis]
MSSTLAVSSRDELGGHVSGGEWRRLLAVVLPVVAGLLLVSTLLDVGLGAGRLVVVDGVPQALSGDLPAGLKAVASVAFWVVGLVGGAWAVTRAAGPREALWEGVKSLPSYGVGLIAVGGGAFLAVWAAAGIGRGDAGVVLVLGVLLTVALAAARLLLNGINRSVGAHRPAEVSRISEWTGAGPMPAWGEAALFLVGGAGVPVLAAYGWARAGLPGSEVVLLAVALVLQVRLATRKHARAAGSGRTRVWPGAAALAAAVVVAAGVVLTNPYGAPVVRTHGAGPAGPMAVAWPAGQHPVIVTNGGVRFCDDDLCRDFTDVNGGPATVEGYGAATVGADGTVVKTAVRGGPATGGPFVHLGRCVRAGCSQAWLPVRASAAEKLDLEVARVEAAGAAAPDGALWFFVAVPVAGGEHGQYRFSLIRCADPACAAPQRHQVGTVARTPQDGYPDGSRARLTIGADGRPEASFWLGYSILRYGCEPVTCANPKQSAPDAGPPGAAWAVAGDRTVVLFGGELRDGETTASVAGSSSAGHAAIAVAGSSVYVAAAQPGDGPAGFRFSVGESVPHWRQTVWRCRDRHCDSVPMDAYDNGERSQLLAVSEDGRVLVVRYDRIALLETPF